MSQDAVQKYRDAIWGTGGEIAPAEPAAPAVTGDGKDNAATRIVLLGKELTNLTGLLTSASLDNKDSEHRSWAMNIIVNSFGNDPAERKVKLPPELVNEHGGDANSITFGVQDIRSAKDHERLLQDVALAKKYFADIKLHTITDPKGNELALVVGVDAKQFNAVVSAERKKESLELGITEARQQLGLQLAPKQEADKGQSTEPFSLNMDHIQARFPKKEGQEMTAQAQEPASISPMQTPAQQKPTMREVA
jgi:hypothetical protein